MNQIKNQLKEFAMWLATWFFIWTAFASILSLSPIWRDDSDPGRWGGRSGMSVKTDSLIGCQFLIASGGGIVPRPDGMGGQVGCRTTTGEK